MDTTRVEDSRTHTRVYTRTAARSCRRQRIPSLRVCDRIDQKTAFTRLESLHARRNWDLKREWKDGRGRERDRDRKIKESEGGRCPRDKLKGSQEFSLFLFLPSFLSFLLTHLVNFFLFSFYFHFVLSLPFTFIYTRISASFPTP